MRTPRRKVIKNSDTAATAQWWPRKTSDLTFGALQCESDISILFYLGFAGSQCEVNDSRQNENGYQGIELRFRTFDEHFGVL